MDLFRYQPPRSINKVWRLFSSLYDVSEEEKLRKSGYFCEYQHTIEIINAALNGSISLEEESIENFNLEGYEYVSNENDNKQKFADAKVELHIVDNYDEDDKIGYGDIHENKIEVDNDDYEVSEKELAFEQNLNELRTLRKKCIMKYNIDLLFALILSLKGIPESVETLKGLVNKDKEVSSLVSELLENKNDGLLDRLLELF